MIELEFRNVDFCGGRKTGEPGEKPSKQGRESTTNSRGCHKKESQSQFINLFLDNFN
jgi:hypothetical protein